ncbi:hypothetical protein BGW80DRAFT_1313635 [Lactifluus volemus]|nr:hypothetical protein BGW80DRAFT_1313635 [Lactifluus volemus]
MIVSLAYDDPYRRRHGVECHWKEWPHFATCDNRCAPRRSPADCLRLLSSGCSQWCG